jgi:hypothetical protein
LTIDYDHRFLFAGMKRGFYMKDPQECDPFFVVHPKILRLLKKHPKRRLRVMQDIFDPFFGAYDLWALRRLEEHLAIKKVESIRANYGKTRQRNRIRGRIFDEIVFMGDFKSRKGTLVTMKPRDGYDRVINMRQAVYF